MSLGFRLLHDGCSAAPPHRAMRPGACSQTSSTLTSLVPLGERSRPLRQQPAEVGVARAVSAEQHEARPIEERDLRADDELHAQFFCLHQRPHHAIDPIAVRERQRLEAQAVGLFHQFIRMADAPSRKE
jgi:hypothetical protein